MTEEQYKKLNGYLNSCFPLLEKTDYVLSKNLFVMASISGNVEEILQQHHFQTELKKVDLTWEDVYSLAKEFIGNINKEYLTEFNQLIQKGILDFNDDAEQTTNKLQYQINTDTKLIDVTRTFSYKDVIILIHEFMHYTNGEIIDKSNEVINRYIIGEFISIYFEKQAIRYLQEKLTLSHDEINFEYRIQSLKNSTNALNSFIMPLLTFANIGKIDHDTVSLLSKILDVNIEQSIFENSCLTLLERFEIAEVTYKTNILYEKEFDQNQLNSELVKAINKEYKYIFGTLLAIYADQYCDTKDIIDLNHILTDKERAQENMFVLLKNIGIYFDSPQFLSKLFIPLINEVEKNKTITR